MTSIRVVVSAVLPYHVALPAGDYPTPAVGGSLTVGDADTSDGSVEYVPDTTRVSSVFAADPSLEWEVVAPKRIGEADRLLRRVNHLLRWFRVAARQPTVVELTRVQIGRFTFSPYTEADAGSVWTVAVGDLVYEADTLSTLRPVPTESVDTVVRNGLATATEPDVAALNLLDAEYAVSVGRFREAVLLCWSVIDSTFVRTFERLVDARLPAEWPDGKRFLKGFDFGLRQKMTTGLRLVAGRSLYEEPDEFWTRLSASYGLRNAIIHAGQLATEDQAVGAIAVAKRMVAVAAELDADLGRAAADGSASTAS